MPLTEIIDGRPRVLHLYDGRARRGLMHKVYYTLVTVTKKIVWIEQTKIGCHGNIPRNPISQQ